jgi:nickel transport protein
MLCWIKKVALIMVFSLVGTGAASAHKVTIFAWAEGDTVYTESKFSGGKVVKNGKVEVFDSQGTRLLEGRTSDQGEFSFSVPKITDLNIVLTAGMGHQNSWKLSAAELGNITPDSVVPELALKSPMVADSPQATTPMAAEPGLTTQAVEAIVARQLEQKLQPLTRMLVAVQDKGPTLRDIIGGIGYIIGLVGLGAYVRYRKGSLRS